MAILTKSILSEQSNQSKTRTTGPFEAPSVFMEKIIMEGKTKSGFKYRVDEDVNDDMELLEGFISLDNGDMTSLPKCIISLLGEDQKKALYDHCRSKKTGRVSAKQVMAEVGEILNGVRDDVKNS